MSKPKYGFSEKRLFLVTENIPGQLPRCMTLRAFSPEGAIDAAWREQQYSIENSTAEEVC